MFGTGTSDRFPPHRAFSFVLLVWQSGPFISNTGDILVTQGGVKHMKRSLVVTITLFAFSTMVWSQTTDTFDIAAFRPPAGWTKQAKNEGVIFSTADKQKGTYAMIVLYQSNTTSGDAKRDFDADWLQFIVGAFGVKEKPQMEPQKQSEGWTLTIGGSTFEGDLGTSAVILSTYTGYGRKFSAAAIFNSQDHVPAIDAFASSIVLSKPTPAAPAPTTTAPAEDSILGTWGSNVGASMTYGDPVAAGMAGYTKSQYTLNADGTYVFNSKTFRMGYDKIILVRENGTYQINGSSLTIKPQKSVIQAWSKLNGVDRFGRLLSTQPRKLETVTYKFTKHYFSGIQEWNLVLQADQTTERDGPFSTFAAFPNAWYYKPISANNPLIELPN